MLITSPSELKPIAPLISRRGNRKRLLRRMLIGSVLLHALLLAGFYLFRDEPPAETMPPATDEVAMEFESPAPSQEASTESANPANTPTSATGNAAAPVAPPSQDTTRRSRRLRHRPP